MAWRIPNEIEEALWQAAGATLPEHAINRKVLHRAIVERSHLYTSRRDELAEGGSDEEADLAARALFFTVCDAPKIMPPLAELEAAGLLPEGDPVRVLDLGAGAGAMSFGAWAALGRRFEVTAVDQDDEALEIFSIAAEELDPELVVHTVVAPVEQSPWAVSGDVDLVLMGSVLNELEPGLRLDLVRRAMAVVADGGAVVIVEPALRETARELHRLRDLVIEGELGHVFAPCVRTVAPCPALEDERDWCHEDRKVELPPRASQLANVTNLRSHGMKYAYLTLRREPASQVQVPAGRVALRVVSQPRKLKGRRLLIGCGEAGRFDVRRLKRHRSEANRPVESARRGDVIIYSGDPEIRKDDEVEVVTVQRRPG